MYAAFVLLGSSASAQSPQPMTAESSFREGLELARRGDCTGAIEKYKLSLAAKPSVGASVNLGECHLVHDRPLSAYLAFEAAAKLASATSDPREGAARHRMQDLYSMIPVFRVEQPGGGKIAVSSIELDGKSVAPLEWWTPFVVGPGEHRLIARSSSGDLSTSFSVSEHGTGAITNLALEPAAARIQHDSPPAHGGGLGPVKVVGITLLAVGGASAITSVVIGAVALGEKDGSMSRAGKTADVATVFGIAGGVLAATGLGLLLFAPSRPDTNVSVGPGTVSFSGRF